jgi:hypothetical protein
MSHRLIDERAPCGKEVAARWYQDSDGQGLVFERQIYACGCRQIRHEFHDGSGRGRIIRHDGKVLMDERSPERGD